LGTPVEDQRHAVAGRDSQEPVGRLGSAELLGRANDLVELTDPGVLLVRRELGVTDDVDEEDVRDLELYLFLVVVRHEARPDSSESPLGAPVTRRTMPRIMRQRFAAGQAGETAIDYGSARALSSRSSTASSRPQRARYSRSRVRRCTRAIP